MKKILSLAVALSLAVCSSVNAATLRVDPMVSSTGVYSLFLSGGPDNGNFDTLIVDITPEGGATLLNGNNGNNAGAPRPAGEPFTYINRYINADPGDIDGGLNWTVLGLTPVAEMAGGLSFTTGPLGATIDTSGMTNGELFLANVNIPVTAGAYAVANVQVVSAGNVLQTLTAFMPVPEPASAGLAGLAVLGLAAIRRRFA